MTNRLEFDLQQGWSKGVSFAFEDMASSKRLDLGDAWTVEQVHGVDLHICSESDLSRTGDLAVADGLILSGDLRARAKRMFIKTADCCPLVYIDNINQNLALVHAGWRGLAQGIHKMPFELSMFDPKSTWLWCGPCLNGKNFEVDEAMWSHFPEYCQNEKFFEAGKNSDKKFFNSWAFLEDWATSIGIAVFYNVECDSFENRSYASYRRFKQMNKPELAKSIRNISWITC